MADEYRDLNGDQQQYVASGVGVKNLDGRGGGGSTRRGTVWSNTKPPSVENPVYEAMYAEPHMMNESVVDAPPVGVFTSPAAPKNESRMGILALVAALLAVTGIGVGALVISMEKSGGFDRNNAAPAATAAPLAADVGLAARVAALEGALAAVQESQNYSDAIDALMARVISLEGALAAAQTALNESSARISLQEREFMECKQMLNESAAQMAMLVADVAANLSMSVHGDQHRISSFQTQLTMVRHNLTSFTRNLTLVHERQDELQMHLYNVTQSVEIMDLQFRNYYNTIPIFSPSTNVPSALTTSGPSGAPTRSPTMSPLSTYLMLQNNRTAFADDGWMIRCGEFTLDQWCRSPQVYIPRNHTSCGTTGWININFAGSGNAEHGCQIFCEMVLGELVTSEAWGPGQGMQAGSTTYFPAALVRMTAYTVQTGGNCEQSFPVAGGESQSWFINIVEDATNNLMCRCHI